MAAINLTPIYDELLDYLVTKATPAEILAFQPSEAAVERATYLTERNKSDLLTSEEAAELQQMLELDLLVSTLKARALVAMKS